MASPPSPPRSVSLALGRLADLLSERGLDVKVRGDGSVQLTGVSQDSRYVHAGDLFLALPGARVDGGSYIEAAVSAGAAAALCDRSLRPATQVALLVSGDVQRAAGHCASLLTGAAAERLELVAVTGTNGKTSCTYLLEQVWHAAGLRAGVIGTVSQRWPGHERAASMTTPSVVDLHRTFAEIAEAGCTHAVLEVSSHALAQHRVSGCRFAAAVFTNLTRDHLDYHGDEQGYFEAKARLFEEYLDDSGVGVVNIDDAWGRILRERLRARCVVTYSLDASAGADVTVEQRSMTLEGMRLDVRTPDTQIAIETRLIGGPNVANIAAVAATAYGLGIAADDLRAGIASLHAIPGRLERVDDRTPVALVDYAHTPDALERVLESVRRVTVGRLIVVFGCGGDRDRGKRPMMGEAAGRLADVAVLTSDNPRTEKPSAIIDDIERGIAAFATRCAIDALAGNAGGIYAVEADRRAAIRSALEAAGAADVVLIAGKGHEDYQEIDGVRTPFDDRETVRALRPTA